jgi:nucleotide-binding universal stress UspA family protein
MTHHFPPRKLLVPTDLGETSRPAFEFARLWRSHFGGDVHVVHAQHFDPPPYFSSGQIQSLTRELKKATKAAAEYLRKESASALGFEAQVSVAVRPPAEAILEAAEGSAADLIIMGTHGRHGAGRFWLGSVAERVLRESPKPVLAVRQGMAASSFDHILCPVNFKEVGREALHYAAAMAEAGQLRLTVLHAVEEADKPPDCDLVPEAVRSRCKIEELTFHGDAVGSILTAAEDLKPDIIVMGAERKTAVLGGLFSSTTERVMQLVRVPLLVVPKQVRSDG